MDVTRILQVLSYGWQHAGEISKMIKDGEPTHINGKLNIFFDILRCYKTYSLWSNQYKKEKFYNLSDSEQHVIGARYLEANQKKAEWTDEFYSNKKFLYKYSSIKYDTSFKLATKRNLEYQKRYNMGSGCTIRYNCLFTSTHGIIGDIVIGKKCAFGRNTDIDYTGGLSIGNGVTINEGSIVLTHGHNVIGHKHDDDIIPNTNRGYLTPLVIEDNAYIGANCLIMPGVKRIGKNSVIQAGSIVTIEIPDNVFVAGNPAKIIFELVDKYERTLLKYK